MNQQYEGARPGVFSLSNGMEVPGQLSLAGRDTSFLAWSDKLAIYHSDFRSITGRLYDARNVSLIDCQDQHLGDGQLSFGGMYNSGIKPSGEPQRTHYTLEVDPSHVIFGEVHLRPAEAAVSRVHLIPEDILALFHDERVIATVAGLTGNEKIKAIAREIMRDGGKLSETDLAGKLWATEVNFGLVPMEPVLNVETTLGRVIVGNQITSDGDANRRTLRNEVTLTLEFDEPVVFDTAMRRMQRVLEFLNLVIGRPQNLEQLTLGTTKADTALEVYVYPEYEGRSRWQAQDTLVDGVNRSEEFGDMLVDWLRRDALWRDVRTRLATYSQERSRFGVDRLVGLANIFDAVPMPYPRVELAEGEDCAIRKTKEIFRRYAPDAAERAMNSLGRMRMLPLKEKVKLRARILTDRIGDRTPDIDAVIDKAVAGRNYFVHGSGDPVPSDAARFLAKTLQFVFSASDLVDAGWDIKRWCDSRIPSSHPFAGYISSYAENLERMNNAGG